MESRYGHSPFQSYPPPPPPPLPPRPEGSGRSDSSDNVNIPEIGYNAPSTFTLRDCPEYSPVSFRSLWYKLQGVSTFDVCSHCYEKYIRNSLFANSFQASFGPAGYGTSCDFNTPRILQIIWPRARNTNSLRELQNYALTRSTIQPCHGTNGTTGTAGVRWFVPKNRADIPGFLVCQACYEDHVLASNFADYFQSYNTIHPIDRTWACDIATPFVKRALAEYSTSNAWNRFTSGSAHRLRLPPCEQGGRKVSTSSRKWYCPKFPNSGISICELCYLDTFAIGSFASDFELQANHGGQRVCIMGIGKIKVAWEEALLRKNLRVLWEAVHAVVSSPLCSAEGISNGTWYSLGQGCENFDICESCHACLIRPFRMERYFVQVRRPSGPRLCDFHPENPRFHGYANKLTEAISVCTFAVFADYVRRTNKLDPCPGINAVRGKLWYGTPECLICELCYEDLVRGTLLAPKLQYQGVQLNSECNCDLFSERMRRLWSEACGKRDLGDFISFAKYRSQIYLQTVPEMQQIVEASKMGLQSQQNLNVLSSAYNNMDGIAAITSNPYYSYGSPGVGYGFSTPFGVEGARFGQQAISATGGMSAAMARVSELEARWKEVE